MITPEIDATHITNDNADAFKVSIEGQLNALLKLTPPHARRSIIVDLHGFERINDTGIAVLIRSRRKAEEQEKAALEFSGVHRRVKRKIYQMGLEQMFGFPPARAPRHKLTVK